MSDRTRLLLGATAVLAVLVFAITLTRVPTPFPDVELYASIARSEQLHGIGVPSVIRNSPYAVDHVQFYGPVFFDLAAASFRVFGVSLWSFRIISLLGALLFAAAGALLARHLSGAPNGWRWSLTLLLLTPELGFHATAGSMDLVAVGLETLALAVFVRGLVVANRRLWHGAGAGLLLTLAALTTPRTYPFIFAFVIAGALLPSMPSEARRAARWQLATAVVVMGLGMSVWAAASHGNPIHWARYVAFILTHEDYDVAVLPTAIRAWSFSWSAAVTPVFAVIGACMAALPLTHGDQDSRQGRLGIAAFALGTGWITLVVTVLVMNLTFTCGTYFALPLFAAVLAMPRRHLNVAPRMLAAGVASLIVCDVGVGVMRCARVAATWSARNPVPLNEFVRTNVPPGSEVIGPEAPYFFAVERSGARYRSASPVSEADWARWVPLIEPDATTAAHRVPVARSDARFLVWPVGDDLPDGYDCARGQVVAVYVPARHHLNLLGRLGARTEDVGYPKSVLYRLPPDCPAGYDPTGSRRSGSN